MENKKLVFVVILLFSIILFGVIVPSQVLNGEESSQDEGVFELEQKNDTVDNNSTCVVFFYSTSCPHCHDVLNYIEQVQEDENLVVKGYVANENSELFREYLEHYNVPSDYWGSVPIVFSDAEYGLGSNNAKRVINSAIDDESGSGCWVPSEDGNVNGTNEPSSDSGDKKSNVSVLNIIGLAIVDAVNPCAIAVLMLLLTTVASFSESQKTTLIAGFSFLTAIFITYFLIGVLIVIGFEFITNITGVATNSLYTVMGVFAILLGLLNLKDWVSHGWGGFAFEVPYSLRPKMQNYLTGPLWSHERVYIGSFISGLFVSLFLLPCTSGPYFVAGGLLSSINIVPALFYIALYNFIFIFPMFVITFLVSSGISSAEYIEEKRKENLELLHLFAGIILFMIGIYMILI